MSTLVPSLWTTHLDQLSRAVRRQQVLTGCGRWICAMTVLLATWLLLDGWLDLSVFVRWLAACSTLLAGFGLGWWWVVRAAWRSPPPEVVAALVERKYPQLQERLLSLVELEQAGDEPGGGSRFLRDILRKQTLRWASRIDPATIVSRKSGYRWLLLATVLVVMSLLPSVWLGRAYPKAVGRLLMPWQDWSWGWRGTIEVIEPHRVVARGRDTTVLATLDWRGALTERPTRLQLVPLGAAGELEPWSMSWNPGQGVYEVVCRDLATSFDYIVQGPGVRSTVGQIEVIDPAEVVEARWSIRPPAYMGLPETTLSGLPGRLTVAERARVALELKFSEPVRLATLRWPGPTGPIPDRASERTSTTDLALAISADGLMARGEVDALQAGQYELTWTDRRGPAVSEPPHELHVTLDRAPLPAWADDTPLGELTPGTPFPVVGTARDDFGLTTFELEVRLPDGTARLVPIEEPLLGRWEVVSQLDVITTAEELLPGQQVSLRWHAMDNRPEPGPQEGWSQPRTVVVKAAPSSTPAEQWRSEVDAELVAAEARLKALAEQLREVHRAANAVAAGREAKLDEAARATQLAEARAQQAALQQQLTQLEQRVAAQPLQQPVTEALQAASAALDEADSRLTQAALEQAREQIEQLSQALDQLAATNQALEQARDQLAQQRQIAEDLSQLAELATRADQLAQRSEQSAEENAFAPGDGSQQSTPSRNSSDQPAGEGLTAEQLAADSAQLADDLAKLLKRRPEIEAAARQAAQQQQAAAAAQAAELAARQRELNAQREQLAEEQSALSPDTTAQPGANAPSKTLSQQQAVAQAAIEQALSLADLLGTDAPATQAAVEFAKAATEAAEQLEQGRLEGAKDAAQTASQAAQQTAGGLSEGQSTTPLAANSPAGTAVAPAAPGTPAAQAQALARQQAALQEALAEQAHDPAARVEALNAAQSLQRARTQQLQDQLADVPAGATPEQQQAFADGAQSVAAAREALDRAVTSTPGLAPSQQPADSATTSDSANTTPNNSTSSTPGDTAAQALEQASRQLAGPATSPQDAANAPPSRVPTDVAEQTLGATEALKAGQAALEEAQRTPAASPESATSESAAGESATAENSAGSEGATDPQNSSAQPEGDASASAPPESSANADQSASTSQSTSSSQPAGESQVANPSPTATAAQPAGELANTPAGGTSTGETPAANTPATSDAAAGTPAAPANPTSTPAAAAAAESPRPAGEPSAASESGTPSGSPTSSDSNAASSEGTPGSPTPSPSTSSSPASSPPSGAPAASPPNTPMAPPSPGSPSSGSGTPGTGSSTLTFPTAVTSNTPLSPRERAAAEFRQAADLLRSAAQRVGGPNAESAAQAPGRPAPGRPASGQPSSREPGAGQSGSGQSGSGSPAGKSGQASSPGQPGQSSQSGSAGLGTPGQTGSPGEQTGSDPASHASIAEGGGSGEPGQGGDSSHGASGSGSPPNLSDLQQTLQRRQKRNWGQLPGGLRTEILQGSQRQAHPEYQRQIKRYFELIAQPADPTATPAPAGTTR